MDNNKRLSALLPAILGITVAVVVIATMFIFPFEKPSSTAAAYFGNAMNGGYVAEDGSVSYYVDGDGGLHAVSEHSHYKLSGADSDQINPSGSYVYYRLDGRTVRQAFSGGATTVLAEDCKYILVSGNWLYYTDSSDKMYKRRLSGGQPIALGLQTSKPFAVVGTYLYFIGADGTLHFAATDGSGERTFLAEQLDCFQVYDSFIYFISEGRACSVASGNIASRKDYGPAEQFIVGDDVLFTELDGSLYRLDLQKAGAEQKPMKCSPDRPHSLCYTGGRLYYYSGDTLYSCTAEGLSVKEHQ